jgi:hypothetical protein
MTIIDSQAKRDHESESAFLHRRVGCETDFAGASHRLLAETGKVRRAEQAEVLRISQVASPGPSPARAPLAGDQENYTQARRCAKDSAMARVEVVPEPVAGRARPADAY